MSEIQISTDTVRPADLRRAAIFRELDNDELAQLSRLFVELQVPADYLVLREGERSEAFYVIRKGTVAVFSDAVGKPVADLAHLGPGDFFGEMGLFGIWKRTASVRSTRETRLLKIASRDLLRFLDRRPEVKRKLEATASYRYSTHVAAALELGRRREVRIGFNHPVSLRLGDGATRLATLINLSIRGLSLDNAPPEWQEGETVSFGLRLPNGELELAGRINWRQGEQVGMRFERTQRNHDMLIQLTIRMLLEATR